MKELKPIGKIIININDCLVVRSSCDYALSTYRYEVIAKGWPYPIAIAYLQLFGTQKNNNSGHLLDINVMSNVQRQGVGTFLHKEIENQCDILVTGAMSKEGLKFIKSLGYKYNNLIEEYVWKKQ